MGVGTFKAVNQALDEEQQQSSCLPFCLRAGVEHPECNSLSDCSLNDLEILKSDYVDTESKLRDDGDPVSDPTLYQSLAGSLQYLTFTRPDISYAVQQVCLYMHDPRKPHFSALKRILSYVRGTLDHGLQLFSSSTTSLVAYSDADWAGCLMCCRVGSIY
ncbi:ribonuclease H-like domain-containing protein [Tanacetum coccineum]